jgi:23S rRNA pseudouridine1911/1915/1917 synthase
MSEDANASSASSTKLRPGETLQEHSLQISESLSGQRIDKALATLAAVGTRSQASRLLARELVFLGELKIKPSHVTKTGEVYRVCIPTVPTQTLVPYDFPLDIAYEDQDLIVVNKPAGLVVHPAYGHAHDTLVNALLHHTKDLSQGFDELRPGLVHRLDKDTSGLIVIAKNEKAQREIALQFQRKITHRIYRALVFGRMKPPEGTITSYLKRHPEDRKRSASVEATEPNAKFAITHYRTLAEHNSGIQLLELKLETGRTHQIRVHMKEAGSPIVGDSVYGADNRTKNLKSVLLRKMISELPRFALHAFELGFYHPRTGDFLKLKAQWPSDLMPLIDHFEFPKFEQQVAVERFAKRPADDYPWPKLRLDTHSEASEEADDE